MMQTECGSGAEAARPTGQAATDAATRAHFTARAAHYAGAGDASLQVMIELAVLRPGERVLDVATGTGAALFALAEQVGPDGLAAGVDFTLAMLAQAAGRLAEARSAKGVWSARPVLLAADASCLPFSKASFDLVACRFAIHHFSNPAASLAAMAAVLRPGGRLVIADFVRPPDPAEAARYDRLERLRGHRHVEILEQRRLEALLAGTGCPAIAARVSPRVVHPQEWLNSPNVAPESRRALAALIDELRGQGGAGFEVQEVDGEVRFLRSDVVLLGVKGS